MSVGSSLSGITFAGIGSGIDTESIISRLIQIESIPINRLQFQQAQLTSRMGLMSQLRGQIGNLQSASNALNTAAAFQTVTATSSNSAVATISAAAGAVSSTYALAVSKLAQAHKVSSTAQSDATTALGYSGSFVVNGKGITVASTDSLSNIAQNINEANAGVTASIINGGAGNTYLTISASTTGAASEVQLANVTGTVLDSLGFISGAGSIPYTLPLPAPAFARNVTSPVPQPMSRTLSPGWIKARSMVIVRSRPACPKVMRFTVKS